MTRAIPPARGRCRWFRALLLGPILGCLAPPGAPLPAAAGPAASFARGPAAKEGPFSYDRKHDLGALWGEALSFGWGEEDAVVLLERHQETWTSDGRRIEYRHRVVRLATELAIETYADLSVPYDSLRTTLTVLSLRTFRDGAWIESGTTAQVEMTPFALDRAPDYSWRRERILMHDGVEIPCVVETAWKIEDREPFRGGISGLEVFPQADPVVQAEFVVLSAAEKILTADWNGLAEEARSTDTAEGLSRTTWSLNRIEPVSAPGPDPASFLPAVAWSTWSNWRELGADLNGKFQRACLLNDAQRDTLKARLREAEAETEVARRIAGLVADKTRACESTDPWSGPVPREAARTYDTAYGTSLDRAALAAALFREAGLAAELGFIGRSFAPIDANVPILDRFDPVRLLILTGSSGNEEVLGLYDPAASTFEAGTSALQGRTSWRPAANANPQGALPVPDQSEPAASGRVSLFLDLRFDGEAKAWLGKGTYIAAGVLAPYGKMEGLADQSMEWLGTVVSGVLEKAEVTSHNPSAFDPSRVVMGLALKLPAPDPDKQGRTRLSLGPLEGGAASLLPGNLPLHRATCDQTIRLPGRLTQELRIRLSLPETEVVRLPEPMTLENGVGRFALAVRRDGDAVTITRTLTLAGGVLPPSSWPELRALLLAEGHDRNRVIVYKSAAGKQPKAESRAEL